MSSYLYTGCAKTTKSYVRWTHPGIIIDSGEVLHTENENLCVYFTHSYKSIQGIFPVLFYFFKAKIKTSLFLVRNCPSSLRFSHSFVARVPNQYSGIHGFESPQGLRDWHFFLVDFFVAIFFLQRLLNVKIKWHPQQHCFYFKMKCNLQGTIYTSVIRAWSQTSIIWTCEDLYD